MVKTSRPKKWRTTYFRSDFWRPLPWRAKPDRGQHEGKNTEKHILRVNTLDEKEYSENEKAEIIDGILHKLEKCTNEEIRAFISSYLQEKRQAFDQNVLLHQG